MKVLIYAISIVLLLTITGCSTDKSVVTTEVFAFTQEEENDLWRITESDKEKSANAKPSLYFLKLLKITHSTAFQKVGIVRNFNFVKRLYSWAFVLQEHP